MSRIIVRGESADLFDAITGKHIGFVDRNGHEQIVLAPSTQVEAADFHYNNTGQQNVAAFNLVLRRVGESGGGVVTLSTPGQYMIGGEGQDGLLIYSNTTLICGSGVELILGDNTHMPLIRNASAFLPGLPLGAVVTWTGNTPTFSARIDYAGIELLYPVGSPIALLGLPGTSAANRGYQGIWKVFSAAANQIFIHLAHQPPAAGPSGPTGVVYPVDINIRIIGGMWDGNKANNYGVLELGEPRSSIISLRNAQGIIVRGTEFRRGNAWCIGANNIRDGIIGYMDVNTYTTDGDFGSHDIVHLAGGHRNVLVRNIIADCPDNIVGLTHDVPDGIGEAVSYPHYDPGDSYDTRIHGVCGRETVAALIGIWGNANYLHHSTVISGITGKCPKPAVQVHGGYPPTNMLNASGGTLIVKDCTGAFENILSMRSGGTWDHVAVENCRNETVNFAFPLVKIWKDSSPVQSIRKLQIKGLLQVVPGATGNRNGEAISITDTNIDDLQIEGLNSMRLGANTSLIAFKGTQGVVKRAFVEKADAVSGASGDSFLVSCENTGAGSLGALTIRDSHMVGTAGTGGVVRQTGTSKVATIRLDNATETGGEGVSVAEAGSTAVVTIV